MAPVAIIICFDHDFTVVVEGDCTVRFFLGTSQMNVQTIAFVWVKIDIPCIVYRKLALSGT